uniref:mediator of RNA polymerase II transcription subunit 6 isoform X1 n=1 Tax=Myxine glutinosa TaxID=7769 RepID=UPI00358F32AA
MTTMDGRDLLGISWHDSNWIPLINPANVLDYFSERSNPFYDRSCNNEFVKMQRQTLDQLNTMTGLEYILLHVQEPILYIVRKQHRHSPTQVTPLTDYYIIAGVVYQAPDIASVINSRILNAVHNIQSAFDETLSYSRYHPSKGYWWRFKEQEEKEKVVPKTKKKEEPSSLFQRQRVDMLLNELCQKFSPKFYQLNRQKRENSQASLQRPMRRTRPRPRSKCQQPKPPLRNGHDLHRGNLREKARVSINRTQVKHECEGNQHKLMYCCQSFCPISG